MSGLDCFKGNLEMSAKVKAYMKRDMPELEASVRVVEEEHKILHNDLNDFRKSIGKSEIKYTAPDLSAAVEKIQTKYNNKIEGLKGTYEFIPSETQYAALKRLTANTADMTAEERTTEFKRRAELHNKSYQDSIKGTLTEENKNTERVADFARMTAESMQRFADNPKPFEGKGETFENGSRIDEDGNVMSEDDFVTLKEKVKELTSQNKSTDEINETPKAYLEDINSPLNIVKDAAENELAVAKLTEQDNPIQEPSIKAIKNKTKIVESDKDKVAAKKLIEEVDKKVNEATGVHNVKVSALKTDEASFQNREDGLNEDAVKDIVENYNPSEFDPITYWTDEKGNKVTLNHHRFEAAKRLGLKEIPAKKLTYPKSHPKAGEVVPPTDKAEAIDFAKNRSNANRKMEEAIDRAKALRALMDKGASKEEIKKFLDREGKNKIFIQNIAALNPNGKTADNIKQFGKAEDRQIQKEVEQRSDWIGEARRTINGLTDAHENEMFDFLFNKDSKRITNKAEFLQKVRSVVNPLIPADPLNIARFKNKTTGETAYENDVADKKSEIADRQQKINDLNDRFTNPQNKGYIATDSEDYVSARKIADDQISILETKRKQLQKELEDIYRNKGTYTGAVTTGSLFTVGEEKQSPLNKAKVQKIIDFFEKGLNLKVFAPLTSFADKLKELGYGSLQAMVGYYENGNITNKQNEQLNIAKGLQKKGISNTQIRKETGWFIGLDSGWKFDIDDSNANFTKSEDELKALSTGSNPDITKVVTLTDVFTHDEFFEKYPELKNKINIVFYEDNNEKAGGSTRFDNKTKQYTLVLNLNFEKGDSASAEAGNLREVILHEIQHTIQGFNGRDVEVTGTSPTYIRGVIGNNRLKIYTPNGKIFDYSQFTEDQKDELADYLYNAQSQEIEARAAMKGNDFKLILDNLKFNFYFVENINTPSVYRLKSTKDLKFLSTPAGRVLGFVSNGRVFLNPDTLSPETTFHELTHIQQVLIELSASKGDKQAQAILNRFDDLMASTVAQIEKGNRSVRLSGVAVDLRSSVYDKAEGESDADYKGRIRNELWSYLQAPANAAKWDKANKTATQNFIQSVKDWFVKKLGLKDSKDLQSLTLEQLIERSADSLMKGEYFELADNIQQSDNPIFSETPFAIAPDKLKARVKELREDGMTDEDIRDFYLSSTSVTEKDIDEAMGTPKAKVKKAAAFNAANFTVRMAKLMNGDKELTPDKIIAVLGDNISAEKKKIINDLFEKRQGKAAVDFSRVQQYVADMLDNLSKGKAMSQSAVNVSNSDYADLLDMVGKKFIEYDVIKNRQLETYADSVIALFKDDYEGAINAIRNAKTLGEAQPILLAKLAVKLDAEGKAKQAAAVMQELIYTATFTARTLQSFRRVNEILNVKGSPVYKTEIAKKIMEKAKELSDERVREVEAEYKQKLGNSEADVKAYKDKLDAIRNKTHKSTLSKIKDSMESLLDRICNTRKK